MGSRLAIDRQHSLSGKNNLDWFFANRKWIRTSSLHTTECAWAKRPLPVDDRSSSEAGIRILLLVPKNKNKRAHDRNKLRRWLRAAITETEDFSQLEETMLARGDQLLVMMRVSKPVQEVTWANILEDVENIAAHLMKRV